MAKRKNFNHPSINWNKRSYNLFPIKNNPASVRRRGYKMGSADVLPTVPRVDLYHRQNVSLLRVEPEKEWIMEKDPKKFGPLLNG